MQLIEVTTPAHVKAFLMLPVRLYKNDPNWIRPLDADIEKVFDPEKNKFFRHGVCTRWILTDQKGVVIGRVAAFVNQKTANAKENDQPTGGMGFFECINDQAAAFLLFDTCKKWLQAQGMEAMDGPINFGERDDWWGLLADGFTEPVYTMNYNFPYYVDLFEAYGFRIYFKQYTYRRIIADPPPARLIERAERIYADPDYSFRHFEVKKLDKFAEDFCTIYNNAWVKHGGGAKALAPAEMRIVMQKMKPVLDEKIIWFAYHKEEPIGFYIQIQDLNQVLKRINGKMDLRGIATFLWYKLRKKYTRIVGLVFGIVPEYQRKGVDAALAIAYSKVAHTPNYPYKEMQMKWIGDFNPKMMRVAEFVGGSIYKTHHTYRKLFDETKEFKRSPMID